MSLLRDSLSYIDLAISLAYLGCGIQNEIIRIRELVGPQNDDTTKKSQE